MRKLKAAAKTEKELRHQLGKVRFAAKEFEDSYNLIYKTREEALAKVPKIHLSPTLGLQKMQHAAGKGRCVSRLSSTCVKY